MIEKFCSGELNTVYGYADYTQQEINSKLVQKMNEVIKNCNSAFEFVDWIKGQGLTNEVVNILLAWKEDGTLEETFNNEIFGELQENVGELQENVGEINSQLDNIVEEVNNLIDYTASVTNKQNLTKVAGSGETEVITVEFPTPHLTTPIVTGLVASSPNFKVNPESVTTTGFNIVFRKYDGTNFAGETLNVYYKTEDS